MQRLAAVAGYKPLLAARIVSSLTVWLDATVVFSLLAFHWGADATAAGVAASLFVIPVLVGGPFFGWLADRANPAAMLVAGYSARGITSLLLLMAPDLSVFVLLVMLKALANASALPPEQVMVRSMLSQAQLAANAGLMTAADQITKVCAPLIAAGTTALYGPMSGLWISAGLSLLAIGCLVPLRDRARPDSAPSTSARGALRLGPLVALLRGSHAVRVSFGCVFTLTATYGLYDPLLALLMKSQGLPASAFGMLVSGTAAGAVCGALAFPRLYRWCGILLAPPGLAVVGLTVLIPGVLAGSGIGLPEMLWLGLWVVNGCAYCLACLSQAVAIQQQCPRHCLGSVSATARSVQLVALVLAPLLGGMLARKIGIPLVFALSGGLAVAGGWFWARRAQRGHAGRQTGQSANREQAGP
ncbi:MFS transporter [Cupriavidus necator]|uniref:MFS transporter n=1 Tax=Cupriavidus necator TaxID=106590 RepID=A0A1U9V298_CUPNE|nr:MFS transporter [Cupriavidus necator]AQV99086.1 MFS transporter [Cupriavidus necator]